MTEAEAIAFLLGFPDEEYIRASEADRKGLCAHEDCEESLALADACALANGRKPFAEVFDLAQIPTPWEDEGDID